MGGTKEEGLAKPWGGILISASEDGFIQYRNLQYRLEAESSMQCTGDRCVSGEHERDGQTNDGKKQLERCPPIECLHLLGLGLCENNQIR